MTRDKLTKMILRYQERVDDGDSRDYIGASSIGSDCMRQIWYQFKGIKAEKVPTKMRRTWAIGKRLEGLVVDWLDEAGITLGVLPVRTLRSKAVPAFQGHIDSVWIGRDGKFNAIIEIKTAKDASFKIFVKKGVKVWNPQYYAQIQAYMGMSGIHSTYILVLNKDNSDLSDELVTFDEEFYQKLETKALMISTAVVAPPKIHGSPLWYQCKMCKFNKVCHK
jgi:hypothetical protein